MQEEVIRRIAEKKIIAIVRGVSTENCLKLAEALHQGGVDLLEVTFPQEDPEGQAETAAAIKALNAQLGSVMEFGAGTVTSVELVKLAKEAGASFIVAPDTNDAVIRAAKESGLVAIPGAMTPSEIKHAYDMGADFVKVFPASDLGVSYFKNIHAPLSQVKLLAVGGVQTENVNDYLAAGAVGAGVAGCLFNKAQIAAGEWQKITENAVRLVETIER